MYNKIEDNFHLANKKALFLNLRNYYESLNQDPFIALPVTFHVKNGLADPEFANFKEHYRKVEEEVKVRKALRLKRKHERAEFSPEQSPDKAEKAEPEQPLPPPIKNIWIIKPGENTNCGNGI